MRIVKGASVIIRGLRAVSDFEYEFQMASANKRLHEQIETLFLMAAEQQHFVASRLVKEVALYGGNITSFVPEIVAKAVTKRLVLKFFEKTETSNRKGLIIV